MTGNAFGRVGWIDLTVPDAEKVSQFYQAVVGWDRDPVSMGDYDDWCVGPSGSGEPIAGICHARGANASIPPAWLLYVAVPDLSASLEHCTRLGGKVVCPVRDMGHYGTMAVISDPAGAVMALIQPASGNPDEASSAKP